jgi:hypothetical protein
LEKLLPTLRKELPETSNSVAKVGIPPLVLTKKAAMPN